MARRRNRAVRAKLLRRRAARDGGPSAGPLPARSSRRGENSSAPRFGAANPRPDAREPRRALPPRLLVLPGLRGASTRGYGHGYPREVVDGHVGRVVADAVGVRSVGGVAREPGA